MRIIFANLVLAYKKLHIGLLIPIFIVAVIAMTTDYNTHTDEHLHLDAFRYYETHWWPAEVGSEDVLYSAYGYSRVFTAEAGYFLYGKAAAFVKLLFPAIDQHQYMDLLLPTITEFKQVTGENLIFLDHDYYHRTLAFLQANPIGPSYLLYRFANVLLLIGTIVILKKMNFKNIRAETLSWGFLTLPLFYYLYSYANTYAFALTIGILLFAVSLKIVEQEIASLPAWKFLVLGLLLGLLLQTRQSNWVAALLPGILILTEYVRALWQKKLHLRIAIVHALLVLGMAFVVILPLKIIYPLTQGDYAQRIQQTAEKQAMTALKPSAPLVTRINLQGQGVSLSELWFEHEWGIKTLRNFYASYNYDTKGTSPFIYAAVWLLWGILLVLTAVLTQKNWAALSHTQKTLYLFSIAVIVVNLSLSLYRSWVQDFTPVGRYLTPSIIPLAILLFGFHDHLSPGVQKLYQVAANILFILCIFGLVVIEV